MSEDSPSGSLPVKSIWELKEGVSKYVTDDGKARWRCRFCNQDFASHHATKVLRHWLGGQDIHKCRAKIPTEFLSELVAFSSLRTNEKSSRKRKSSELAEDISGNQLSLATSFESQRKRSSKTVSRRISDGEGSTRQTLIGESGQAKLTAAIVDFIYSLGLPFNIADNHYFRRVITLSKCVTKDYKPPNRKSVGGNLLQVTYEKKMQQVMDSLQKQKEHFGLGFYGDGATIRKTPFMNVMACGVFEPAAVLDIHDCSGHLTNGGKKDAAYIATELFLPRIKEIDPGGLNTDIVFFDGASNVQKAGEILAAKFPRITVVHGAEHVVSLFFKDVAALTPMKTLIRIYKRAYRIFGAGAMHGPYCIFEAEGKFVVLVIVLSFCLLTFLFFLSSNKIQWRQKAWLDSCFRYPHGRLFYGTAPPFAPQGPSSLYSQESGVYAVSTSSES